MGKGRRLLRVLRAAQEPMVTQGQVARLAGMHRLRYWAIENGEVEPSETERDSVAAALGVTASDIAWPEIEQRVSA